MMVVVADPEAEAEPVAETSVAAVGAVAHGGRPELRRNTSGPGRRAHQGAHAAAEHKEVAAPGHQGVPEPPAGFRGSRTQPEEQVHGAHGPRAGGAKPQAPPPLRRLRRPPAGGAQSEEPVRGPGQPWACLAKPKASQHTWDGLIHQKRQGKKVTTMEVRK